MNLILNYPQQNWLHFSKNMTVDYSQIQIPFSLFKCSYSKYKWIPPSLKKRCRNYCALSLCTIIVRQNINCFHLLWESHLWWHMIAPNDMTIHKQVIFLIAHGGITHISNELNIFSPLLLFFPPGLFDLCFEWITSSPLGTCQDEATTSWPVSAGQTLNHIGYMPHNAHKPARMN